MNHPNDLAYWKLWTVSRHNSHQSFISEHARTDRLSIQRLKTVKTACSHVSILLLAMIFVKIWLIRKVLLLRLTRNVCLFVFCTQHSYFLWCCTFEISLKTWNIRIQNEGYISNDRQPIRKTNSSKTSDTNTARKNVGYSADIPRKSD